MVCIRILRAIKKREEDEEEDFKKKMTKGAILVLNDVPKGVKRDAIKEQFNNYGTCSWVDLDDETAEVRAPPPAPPTKKIIIIINES